MVPIDMSQYDCPHERNCMMNDKRKLYHRNNLWKEVKSRMVQNEINCLIELSFEF